MWTFVALLLFNSIFWRIYLPTASGYDVTGYILGRDFADFWVASKLTLTHQVDAIFSLDQFMVAMRAQFGPSYTFHWWSYPPTMLLLIAPLALLPYFQALALWSILGLAAFLAATRMPRNLWLLTALAPASLINLLSGMNGFFTAALFLGGLRLSQSKPILAGILIGLLTVKPHLGLLLPIVLLMQRNYRCIFTATLTALLLAAASYLLWGIAPWQHYQTVTIPHHQDMLANLGGFFSHMMPGTYVSARFLGLGSSMSWVLHFFIALPAIFLALRLHAREQLTPRTTLALSLASFLATPYGYNYDMVAIAGALALYFCSTKATPAERVVFGVIWATPLLCYVLNPAHLPLAPLCMVAGLVLLITKED